MLQVALLRENPEAVKRKLAVKHFNQIELVDEIIRLDDLRKATQAKFDEVQSSINAASKNIGALMGQGKKQEAEALKKEISELKPTLEPIKTQYTEIERELYEKLVLLPNLPQDEVPAGKSAEDNVVVRQNGDIHPPAGGNQPHWDLIREYDLVDFETGAKITGRGFPLYTGQGAKFQRALIQYFLDFNTAAGYREFIPPFMVNEASAFATGQLPDKEGQMYHVTEDNFYLIPTAEVPVTNIYRDTILQQEKLPLMLTAYSPCFRREAGSFGKDVRGLNRVHQFEKVEIIQITHPDKSGEAFEQMVEHVEKLLQSLELPYRILRLCGGDMSFTSAITYDFEVYSAAQERWLEVSSVSNFETYQANRLKCRFKNDTGKTQLVHTLNGSSLALPRIVAALLENNQTPEGIKIPKALKSYFGKELITK
ncbi:serine--tRNA ligase [Arachidicoccus ginsenosidivorans]|jgi:seryl-tRNA synthetase|uniref:Serine--tRNA ligase n=1 Tax=Arachidicoccus ginsenosidivorans TaxID=496057 RepID=A0A5B8VK69_9BACT|nr:serine--tRNA ligase [Arachidicoccus ginsenosidivorans]QEC71947.1 serine--tRNA ligase [Arachidicoccus ginsenosidivorans]